MNAKSMHEIDILLATYQGEKYIEEMITSIEAQTYTNWKLFISDDSSTDRTCEIVKKLAEKNSKIQLLPPNGRMGVIQNFSRLMENSKAPYIMFADQDDVWFPNKIQVTLEKMKQCEREFGTRDPILIHTDLQVVDGNLAEISSSFWKYARLNAKGSVTLNRLLMQNVVTGCTVMLNRSLLQKSFPIPPEACMHDWWIALVAAQFGRIGMVDLPTMAYRQHGSNEVGAAKYNVHHLYAKFRKLGFAKIRKRRENRLKQAIAFSKRYGAFCSKKQNLLIQAFLRFSNTSNPLLKLRLMLKHHFYKSGFLRNCAEFLDLFRNPI